LFPIVKSIQISFCENSRKLFENAIHPPSTAQSYWSYRPTILSSEWRELVKSQPFKTKNKKVFNIKSKRERERERERERMHLMVWIFNGDKVTRKNSFPLNRMSL